MGIFHPLNSHKKLKMKEINFFSQRNFLKSKDSKSYVCFFSGFCFCKVINNFGIFQ
jgi:hypothetical protein